MAKKQPENKQKQTTEHTETDLEMPQTKPEPDSFSRALFGAYPEQGATVSEQVEPEETPIFSEESFFDAESSSDILRSITQDVPGKMHRETATVSGLPSMEDQPLLLQAPERRRFMKKIPVPLLLLVIALFSYVLGYIGYHIDIKKKDAERMAQEMSKPWGDIVLQGKAAYVYDVNQGKTLYEYHANDVLPLASLTKLMTAIVTGETLPSDAIVTIDKKDIDEEGDTGLRVGESWRLADIIGFTLMTSSNDGASALATVAGSLGQTAYGVSTEEAKREFVVKMNTKAQELGLRGTHFYNETGLDVDGEVSGGYGTAHDVAVLMAHAIQTMYPHLEATSVKRITLTSLNNIRHISTNTNEQINSIPSVIASKTGFTDLAGGNLVIAFDAGIMHPIVISVLGSTREGRFEDVKKLVWAALKSLDK